MSALSFGAGCRRRFRILDFNPVLDGPDLYGALSFLETMPSNPSLQTILPVQSAFHRFDRADMPFCTAHVRLSQSGHCECESLYKHDPRTDLDATIQVHDIPVVHANAARGHEAADRARIVGAVDGEFVVDQHQCRGAHRILRGATLNVEVRRALSAQRYRRLPRRLDVFAGDPRGAKPLLAGAANADRVLERMILAGDEIKPAFLALYHDGAGLGIPGVWDLFGGGACRQSCEDDRGGGENE